MLTASELYAPKRTEVDENDEDDEGADDDDEDEEDDFNIDDDEVCRIALLCIWNDAW